MKVHTNEKHTINQKRSTSTHSDEGRCRITPHVPPVVGTHVINSKETILWSWNTFGCWNTWVQLQSSHCVRHGGNVFTLLQVFMSAPILTSTSQVSLWPSWAARCNGVNECCLREREKLHRVSPFQIYFMLFCSQNLHKHFHICEHWKSY